MAGNYWIKRLILRMSWFVDKTLFKDLKPKVDKISEIGSEFDDLKIYNGYNLFINPFKLLDPPQIPKYVPIFKRDENELIIEATELAVKLRNGKSKDVHALWELDCRLYADKIFSQLELITAK